MIVTEPQRSNAQNSIFATILDDNFSRNAEVIADRLSTILKFIKEANKWTWFENDTELSISGTELLKKAGVDISDIDISSFEKTIDALREIHVRVAMQVIQLKNHPY